MKENGYHSKNPAIAIIIRTLGLGGAEKQSILLANQLIKDYKVFLIVQYGDVIDEKHLEILDKENVILYRLTGNWLSKIFAISRLMKKEKIRILFPYLMSDNIMAFLVTLLHPSVKVAGGIRNCYLPKSKFLVLKVLHKINHTITIFNNTSGQEDFLKKGFNPTKTTVIVNCIEHINSVIVREPGKNINLVTIGRFVAQKDYFTALRFFKLLNDEYGTRYNLHYTIVGYGGLENQIRSEISKLDLTGKVELAIKPNNIPYYYEQAHIYICSSLFEGVSNSIMEAMNYSLPIIATNVGDNKMLVKQGENGFLVEPGNPEALYQASKYLIENHDLRISFGKNSNTILKRDFGEEKFKYNYNNLIQKII